MTFQLNVGNANLVPVLENELQQSTSNGALQVRNPQYSTTAGLFRYTNSGRKHCIKQHHPRGVFRVWDSLHGPGREKSVLHRKFRKATKPLIRTR